MSKRIEARVTCSNCQHEFDFTLYRTIWGEHAENRELVMSDKINVSTCEKCGTVAKLPYALMYTNAKQNFAVWWEPEHDPQIDADTMMYKALGEGNYMANAPRIKDWEEFKKTIIKFETGELQGKTAEVGSDNVKEFLQAFVQSIESKNQQAQNQSRKQSNNSGCLVFLACSATLSGLIYSLSQLL